MTATVTALWRHPIKAIGREAVERVTLEAGQTMPWDRHWAVAHQKSSADGSEWVPCGNFLRAVNIPTLMAVEADTDEARGRVTLRHVDRPEVTLDPVTDEAELLAWLQPLTAGSPFQPARVVRAASRGLTDSAMPSITLCNAASHADMAGRAGRELSIHRWRGNIWIDGFAPWEEFDWIGREVRIGDATLAVRERTGRCKATHADPDTGIRDIDMLGLLSALGHQDFSVQAEVTRSGAVAIGDTVELL
ncbi:MOSC domain protein [Roseivivax jejudonensis]|uniref:MOSC domain protein n=1 Tax=Roseivivax jejudonensis TaxID=1529041 RepID=A0A1X6YDY0_9RHOB|nr:MOSC N-terminal beta barrel domain-containing protein [Roseivivax jejudonensis]SLN18095.1 MOSC domain protein [Roseivivax jejudonensis]